MGDSASLDNSHEHPSSLTAPPIDANFERVLDELVALAAHGHRPDSQFFNPADAWLISHARVYDDLHEDEQARVLEQARQISLEAERANEEGKAASRAWPDIAVRLNSGGLAFFSQLGVVRRPDLTQYLIDGFEKNRDALAFSEANQALFTEVFHHIVLRMNQHFTSGDTIVQSDRQICDAPGRTFHARQLLFGTHYLQIPLMWRQLTFDLPEDERQQAPDILEVSIPPTGLTTWGWMQS